MKGNSGSNRRKGNSHDDRYWDRLKGQFKASAYDHTGAYSELRQLPKTPERHKFERQLELAEQIMATPRYKNLREQIAYAKNTKRLSAVLNLKVLG